MCSRVFGDTKIWGCPVGNGKPSPKAQVSSSESQRCRSALKTLELSWTMHPKYISHQIFLALNSSVYNGLSCSGLNLLEGERNRSEAGVVDDEDDDDCPEEAAEAPYSYVQHLRVLIHSRKWLRLEFHRCLGVETLLWMPAEEAIGDGREKRGRDDDDGAEAAAVASDVDTTPASRVPTTTEVDFLILKLRRGSKTSSSDSYEPQRHGNFFVHLWNHWRVRKLSLSMNFNPEWTREFCAPTKHSALEDLELYADCKWHRRPPPTTPVASADSSTTAAISEDASGSGENNKNSSDKNSNDENCNSPEGDGIIVDNSEECWELFCRSLRFNHPHLKSLEIHCQIRDHELAHLVDHAIGPQSPSLPIEKLHFGKMCNCDETSLRAFARLLSAPSTPARRWKYLSVSRGFQLPSRASLEMQRNSDAKKKSDESSDSESDPDEAGLLDFCHALKHATSLTHLELGDYVLDEIEMRTLFESLVRASAVIQRLSLFTCTVASLDVYEKVLCGRTNSGSICHRESQRSDEETPHASSCLIQNKLPALRLLHLRKDASKALCEVLKSNTSIEWINNHGRTSTHEYYMDLNRGGRRILSSSNNNNNSNESDASVSVAPSLWPNVLERACADLHTLQGLRKDRYCGGTKRKHDVVYCLLRNRILLELP